MPQVLRRPPRRLLTSYFWHMWWICLSVCRNFHIWKWQVWHLSNLSHVANISKVKYVRRHQLGSISDKINQNSYLREKPTELYGTCLANSVLVVVVKTPFWCQTFSVQCFPNCHHMGCSKILKCNIYSLFLLPIVIQSAMGNTWLIQSTMSPDLCKSYWMTCSLSDVVNLSRSIESIIGHPPHNFSPHAQSC